MYKEQAYKDIKGDRAHMEYKALKVNRVTKVFKVLLMVTKANRAIKVDRVL